MNLEKHLKSAKNSRPNIFAGLPSQRAARIVRAVLREIGRKIDETPDGVVSIEGIGRFRISNSRLKKKDGTTVPWRRVVFLAGPPGGSSAKPRKSGPAADE